MSTEGQRIDDREHYCLVGLSNAYRYRYQTNYAFYMVLWIIHILRHQGIGGGGPKYEDWSQFYMGGGAANYMRL